MTVVEGILVVLAGIAAGTVNTIVGSGSLISFPALLAVGLPPVTANISNTVGLVPGSVSGAWGYRRELAGQRRRILGLGSMSVLGGLLGGFLLLVLPAGVFQAVVPVLIGVALVLVVLQPRLAARAAARHSRRGAHGPREGGPLLSAGVLGTGVYGGYFGAAQGVILMGLMGVLLDEDLQRINAVKNVLTGLVNFVAALFFAAAWLLGAAEVSWLGAGLIAVGAATGGVLGARIGRRLPAPVLRAVIIVVGVVAIVSLVRG